MLYRIQKLIPLLEVRSYFDIGRTSGFSEKIVYKDWGIETEIHIDIILSGHPVSARRSWNDTGAAPWVWQYHQLEGEEMKHTQLPFFEIVLSQQANLKITVIGKNGKRFSLLTDKSFDRLAYFSTIFTWFEVKNRNRPSHLVRNNLPTACVPRFIIRRPQTLSSSLNLRADKFFELTNSSLLYFPRHNRTRADYVHTIVVEDYGKENLRKLIDRQLFFSKNRYRTETSKGSEYIISTTRTGHIIQAVSGEYTFSIDIDKLEDTAAYNFEFVSKEIDHKSFFDGNSVRPRNWDEVRLYIHHSSNVLIKVQALIKIYEYDVKVYVKKENSVASVTKFGEPIPNRNLFSRWKDPNSPPLLETLYTIGMFAIAFVPVYGWIAALALSVGELVYTYRTGKDFFNNKVPPTEFAIMGILGIVGAVIDVRSALRTAKLFKLKMADNFETNLRRSINQSQNEYEAATRGSVEAVENVGDHPIAKVIASLPEKKQVQLANITGRITTPVQYLRMVGKIITDHMSSLQNSDPDSFRLIMISILEELLAPDGKGLASEYLQRRFIVYIKRTKNPNMDPLEWLHLSKSKPVRIFLMRAIGSNYRDLIKSAIRGKNGKNIVMATRENIKLVHTFYDEIFALGLVTYRELNNFRRRAKFNNIRALLKDCFQLEHPVELRFSRNLDGAQRIKDVDADGKVRWVLDLEPHDVKVREESLAIIAPRTSRHAILLQSDGALHAKSALNFSQHPKTRLVSELIPNGAEHLAEPQEIADAICMAILSVNFDKLASSPGAAKNLMSRLQVDFDRMTRLINKTRGTEFQYPKLILDFKNINPTLKPGGKGFPRFAKNRDGDWFITNLQDVIDARGNR